MRQRGKLVRAERRCQRRDDLYLPAESLTLFARSLAGLIGARVDDYETADAITAEIGRWLADSASLDEQPDDQGDAATG